MKRTLLGTGLVLVLILSGSAIYGWKFNWTFPITKSQAVATLTSAIDLIKPPLKSITGLSIREEEQSAMRDLSAELEQAMNRFDHIERGYGASLDKLVARINQNSSSRFAEITSRLDILEKKTALPAAPAFEFAGVVSRLDKLEKRVGVATASAPEVADLTTRLDKLEKRAGVAAAPASELADINARLNRLERSAATATVGSAKPISPATPKQSVLKATAEPSPSNEIASPDNERRLLRDYSVEEVQDGVAVVDGRNGPQQVAPGDFIPGAGRVLRIERRGRDWVVVTSLGVIASAAAPQ